MSYESFLENKRIVSKPAGIEPSRENPALFPFQRDIVRWALRMGRAAIFADCGLGKTAMQLEWAHQISESCDGQAVLIFAPLAVAEQTRAEGEKFGIPVHLCNAGLEIQSGVNVTNYEKLHKFSSNHSDFAGIVLDESSILKAFDGKTRNQLIEFAEFIPFRLACTATPAPNDHMELGNHAEFLSIMDMPEMLATFFVHDGGDTSKWRLKGHAQGQFWKWMASWAVMLRKPSDLGYSDDGFALPPLQMHMHSTPAVQPDDALFAVEAKTLLERRQARRDSLTDRVLQCGHLVNDTPGSWLVWCDLNVESKALTATIPGSVQVTGSDSPDFKREALLDFANGKVRVLVSKPSICGFGMNFQICHNIAFVGLSDSYEAFYQAVRRCWRFGQTQPVDCHVIASETEGAVVKNIERKEKDAARMAEGMVEHMAHINQEHHRGTAREEIRYEPTEKRGDRWRAICADAVAVLRARESDAFDYMIYSPPFASLYTYSASERDMGNTRNHEEFGEHYAFLVTELYRTLKPGRLLSFHCMNLPLTKERDGVIGIRDFRGELIRLHQAAGFIFHSEVCIWKDPVTAMQRTKAIGLLYKQLRKDSCISRQGIPDYLVTMRKPGENQERVTKTHEGFPVDRWQRYASPVWMDIDASDTLQRESAREEKDERHICPLQLGVIRRAIELWTNPDDLVLSPFGGIGSEGYVALQMGRRSEIIELKRSYWEQAWRNLETASKTGPQDTLFASVTDSTESAD